MLSEKDCLSRQTDKTTKVLNEIIQEANLLKPLGFSQYTYQHPLISTRKSRIDLFLVSSQISCKWQGVTRYYAFSDHQAVVLFPYRVENQGLGLWHLSNDLLKNPKCFEKI